MKENSIWHTLTLIGGVLSLPIALVTIVNWMLDFSLAVYLWTLAVLVIVSLGALIRINGLRPWHPKFRPPFFRLGSRRLSLRRKINMRLRRPLYEIDYLEPTKQAGTTEIAPEIADFFARKTTVIIEDDPVGFNCNATIPVYAIEDQITERKLLAYFEENRDEILGHGIFFIATPSRRLDAEHSRVINQQICAALEQFFRKHGRPYRIIGKIDSCLRSNYESEHRGAVGGTGDFDLEILVPAYVEEGRITAWGTQYIVCPNRFEPMHQSEYCYFNGLEYGNSNIALWLEKKTGGRIRRNQVGLVDVEMLRSLPANEICDRYLAAADGIKALVFDSVAENDSVSVLNVLVGLDARTEKIFYKLSASMINVLIRTYAAMNPAAEKPAIAPAERGVIVVGSLSTITKKQVQYIHNDIDMSLFMMYNSEFDSKDSDKIAEKKKKKMVAECRKGSNIILTTEFWEDKSTKYPSLEKRDTALRYFARIIEKIRNSNNWFLFVGSDTALYSVLYGLGIRRFYYCGHLIPGVIQCRFRYEGETEYRTFYINGGNNGSEDLFRRLVDKLSPRSGAAAV